MSRVFISYAREDADLCKVIATALQAHGLDVWFDGHIVGGRGWRESIVKAIDQMDCMVVIWSPNSFNKTWVIEEATVGASKGCLIPLIVDDTTPPMGFRSLQHISVSAGTTSLPAETDARLLEAVFAAMTQGSRTDVVDAVKSRGGNSRFRFVRLWLLIVPLALFILLATPTLLERLRTKAGMPVDNTAASTKTRDMVQNALEEAQIAYREKRFYEANVFAMGLVGVEGANPTEVARILFLSGERLGKSTQGTETLVQLIQRGLSANRIDIKFLFEKGSNEFIRDAKISGKYSSLLDLLALELAAHPVCVDVIGHEGRIGSELRVEQLSLVRAEKIRLELVSRAPQLAGRVKAIGKGFQENIVGTGADDDSDMLDRRVGFVVTECRSK